jgi:hypothetical protein
MPYKVGNIYRNYQFIVTYLQISEHDSTLFEAQGFNGV